MTLQELMMALTDVCPMGTLGEDNDGQLIFYTDLLHPEPGNIGKELENLPE